MEVGAVVVVTAAEVVGINMKSVVVGDAVIGFAAVVNGVVDILEVEMVAGVKELVLVGVGAVGFVAGVDARVLDVQL